MKLEGLKTEKEKAGIKAVINGTLGLIGGAVPGAAEAGAVIMALAEADYGSAAEAQANFPYGEYIGKYADSTGMQVAHTQISNVISGYYEYKRISQEIAETEEYLRNAELSQGIRVKFELLDESGKEAAGSERIAGEGILLPQTVLNLEKWETEGIGAYLEEEGIVGKPMEDMVRDLIKINTGNKEWEMMINGGDISSIEPETLSQYICEIDEYIEENYEKKVADISTWVRRGATSNE